jgi:transposase
VHQELKRPGVTLMLLWEEYATGNPLAYKYTSFCVKYAEFAKSQQRSMRQVHIAGEKLFVDYAGDTVPIVDAATGEITQAQIFVATLGRVELHLRLRHAAPDHRRLDRCAGAGLEFIGGVPKPDRARPDPRAHQDPRPLRPRAQPHLRGVRQRHYGCAVLAARPAHPRDKPKVEGSVLLVQSVDPGAAAQPPLLQPGRAEQGHRRVAHRPQQPPFKKLPGCRRSAFESLDAPALRPMPVQRYAIGRWKTGAKVNIDYHVEFEGHYYSVPHRLVGAKIDVRVTGQLLECFASNQRVAGHAVSAVRGGFTTTPEHMPASHRAHLQWTPAKLIAWGQRIGVSTAAVVTWQLEHRPHPEQGYRACLGLLALVRRYSAERLEAACTRAMAIRAPNLRSVTNILKCGLDRQPSLFPATSSPAIEHENVRGPDYYH